MRMRSLQLLCAVSCLALAIPGCGGGGGGSGGGVITLNIQSIQVQTQPQGPESPFGTTQGGDIVIISGTGFVNGLTVRFGLAFGQVQAVTATLVTVLAPAAAQGFVTITIVNPGGETDSLANTFQFIAPPVILSIQTTTGPTTGENRAPIAGGETLQLSGTNFKTGATVAIDGQQLATNFVSATRLTVSIPGTNNEQAVDVSVTNPEGLLSTLNRGLIYTQEFSLDQDTRSLTESRARHLFRRAAFGATQRRIAQAVADGLITTVNNLVNYTNDVTVEQEALAAYGANVPPVSGINNNVNKHWWIHQMVKNPNGFQERFAYFLHNHFAISEVGFSGDFRWSMFPYVSLMRRFTLAQNQALNNGAPGLGFDWRQLCIEMAKDQAMLDWLDGRVSRVGAPNENFARELWELFMLGEGIGYTEIDIQNAARAFTGFVWLRQAGQQYLSMEYRPSRHDAASKTIFGVTGNFGYDNIFPFHQTDPNAQTDVRDTDGGIVALTLAQRPVEASRFICGKLAEFFLYDNVHDIVVDELAADLRTAGPNQWSLRPIIEKILNSKAMYSSRALKGKIKNPIEFVMGFLRTTAIDLSANRATNMSRIRAELQNIGQVVLDPPDVNGWPNGIAWLGSQAMLERTNFVNFAVLQLDTEDQVNQVTPAADAGRSAIQLVDHIAGLLDVQLSGNARTRLINYVNEGGVFNPNDFNELKKKVRGLLWAIAPYHDGHQD